RYAHLSADPLKIAADKISGQIAAALAGESRENIVPLRGKG
ncbi:MAG: integrase, partial [Magnetococcales bacterium]|nr:integrase [Magnetococcales bacterium]